MTFTSANPDGQRPTNKPSFDVWVARKSLALIGEGDWTPQDSLLGLACDEIERLRGALVDISGYGISPNNGYPVVSADVVKKAKAALR